MHIETWSDSNIGLVRKTNQDTVGCFPEASLFVVADGMGGRSDGEVASRLATEVIHSHFPAEQPPAPEPEKPSAFARLLSFGRAARHAVADGDARRLRLAIEAANRRVYDEGQAREATQQGAMGTTVIALRCLLPQSRAHWAYVGDSRLYRMRGGRLALLTADHTLYGEAFREEDEIPSDLPHTNRLVRAVGIRPEVEVSTGSDTLEIDDLFLLCSDGVSGMVPAGDLETEMTSGRSLEEIGPALIRRALDGGGKDNASALLIRVCQE
jgi:protein phosphatase